MALSCSASAKRFSLVVFFIADFLRRCRMGEPVREDPIAGSSYGGLMIKA